MIYLACLFGILIASVATMCATIIVRRETREERKAMALLHELRVVRAAEGRRGLRAPGRDRWPGDHFDTHDFDPEKFR